MTSKIWGKAVALLVSGLVLAPASHAADHPVNFKWNRGLDWTAVGIPGSSDGNPTNDKLGHPTWFYGYTTGGALNSDKPWYAQTLTPMVWDDDWWGSNAGGLWARGYNGPGENNDNANPPISKWGMVHDVSAITHSIDYMPVVEWRNPVGSDVVVNVGGALTVKWEGQYVGNTSPQSFVEIAFAKVSGQTGAVDLLYSTTVANPTAGGVLDATAKVTKNWGISNLALGAGDSLRLTLRSKDSEHTTPLWILLDDQSSSIRLISVVPEPETYALALLGGALVCWRTRRRSAAKAV